MILIKIQVSCFSGISGGLSDNACIPTWRPFTTTDRKNTSFSVPSIACCLPSTEAKSELLLLYVEFTLPIYLTGLFL